MYASLTYRDLDGAAAWLNRAFGFSAQLDDGLGVLRYGDGRVLVHADSPDELHGSHLGKGRVYVQVADIDAHYRQAAQAGAQLLGAPHKYGDGFRGYSARDVEGNLWSFRTSRAE